MSGHLTVDELLAAARAGLRRVDPERAAAAAAGGGVLVDIRPEPDRAAEGVIPGAWIVDRNVLEWRLDPACPHRLPRVTDALRSVPVVVVCNEGYASSLAAASLQLLGLGGATDLEGGYRAWAAAGLPTEAGPGVTAR
ncbi:MAG TPA: rhodanese-like domain-containing protein [Acidimicrobiales bacterium]|nr:rhodanese-like domain-containing protein [Acidimicrobiales bacterium]